MKAIIDRKIYNTETAEVVHTDGQGYASDFHHWQETLYRATNGTFFLYGIGGPMSKYAESTGQNSWSGGEKIIPLTEGDAIEWLEDHDGVEALEKHFSGLLSEA